MTGTGRSLPAQDMPSATDYIISPGVNNYEHGLVREEGQQQIV